MTKRLGYQVYCKFIVFSRTPILYLTTYFIPIFCLYYFGRGREKAVFDHLPFVNYYLPLYISIGLVAISIFTIGMDLVSKRERKMYKRINMSNTTRGEQFLVDCIFSIFLSIPLVLVLLIEAKALYHIEFHIFNLLFIIPFLLGALMNSAIAYLIFGMIDDNRISSPLQISIFGFSLFGLGIIMPYSFMSESMKEFIKFTPYYYINKLSIMFWNNKIELNNAGVFIAYVIIIVFACYMLAALITYFVDRGIWKLKKH